MSSKPITLEELAAMYLAGGRNSGERSNAKPQRMYRDPADSFEFPTERLRREEAKRVERAKKKRR